jgi:hypothetical protein
VRLERGRLRDDGDRTARLRPLDDRRQRLQEALRDVSMDALDHRNRAAPIYFVDPRVPMATVGQVILHTATGSFGLALRGPRGLAVLEYAARLCAPVPSVELDVHAASFVLRTSTGRGGCTGGPDDAQVTTVTFARTGVDRGPRHAPRGAGVAMLRTTKEHRAAASTCSIVARVLWGLRTGITAGRCSFASKSHLP